MKQHYAIIIFLLGLFFSPVSYAIDYDSICKSNNFPSLSDIRSGRQLQSVFSDNNIGSELDFDEDGKVDQMLICFGADVLFNEDNVGGMPGVIIIKNPHAIPLVIHNLNIHMAPAGQLSVRDNVILSHVTVTGSSQMPVDVEGKSITLDHATIMSSDIGIEIRGSQGVEIANSDIQAITGINIARSQDVRISKTHLNVTQLGIELNDAGKPILTDVTFPENENDITENRDIDYILMPDQEKMALDRIGITKIEDEEEKVFVTDIVGLAPSCEGDIHVFRMVKDELMGTNQVDTAFTCEVRQMLSHDHRCLTADIALDCAINGNCDCFKKPDCIFECSGLSEPDQNKIIFAHVDNKSQLTHLSEPFDLGQDDIASIQLAPSELPSPMGRQDVVPGESDPLGDDMIPGAMDNPMEDPALAGDELDASNRLLALDHDGIGDFGSNPGGTAPTTGVHERGEKIPEHTIGRNGDDSDMMEVDLSGLGAQAGTSCSLNHTKSGSYYWLMGLMVLFFIRRFSKSH